ncbi:MAG: enoyl-CoA hydratase/isomerase family protein [Gammaproteobacteria bacterium]|nr:enoyl-CoA hydratase/isomerase family protein [Gammaproteobacteria bacterium]
MSLVTYSCENHVATIAINRPDAMNAFNPELYVAFNEATAQFKQDDDAWVAVITSTSEKSFSVGVDIKALNEVMATNPDMATLEHMFSIDLEGEYFCDKPILVAIRGYCVGEGLSLALGADIRVAGKSASFCLPEAKIGVPTVNAAIHATRLMGKANAMELLLTGEQKDASWAEKKGLVNIVVDDKDVEKVTLEWAHKIAALSPLANRATKRIIGKTDAMSFEELSALGATLRKSVLASNDAKEGRQAFIEKRQPNFTAS